MSRPLREAESRAAEIRAQRGPKYNHNLGLLVLPDSMKRDGYVAHGARIGISGIADARVEQLAGEGWQPIPSSRVPNFSHDPLKRDRFENQNVISGDVLWMEIPEEIIKEKWDYEAKINDDKVKGLPNLKATHITRGGFDQF